MTLPKEGGLTVGSLFTGIGGIDLACEWAGMEVIWQCEIDPFCQKVLQKHWPGVKLYDDIHKINRTAIRPDIIVGGFPCQPYSIAGKRRGKEDDRDLWPEMLRVVQELKPRWVVGENVANFVNMELERTLSDLEGEGYETETFVLPARGVGAKHQRYRTIVVANSNSKRLQRREKSGSSAELRKGRKEQLQGLLQTGLWPDLSASDFNREGYGISGRMDRLRALGNAVVPQQIYPIMKGISLIEEGFNDTTTNSHHVNDPTG